MRQYRPGILLFILFLIIALFWYKDYGISYDEPAQVQIGTVSYNYVFKGDDSLNRFCNKSYGVGFELPLIMLEKKLHFAGSRDVYLMRHLITHLFFLLSVFCGYILVYRLYKSQFLACMAFLMFALDPRIYAHSYFNSKDLPFLSIVLITLAVAQFAFEKNNAWRYLLLGIVCGYGTSLRVMELLFVYIFCAFLLIDFATAIIRKEKSLPVLRNLGIFIAGFALVVYAAWPLLWQDPINNFINAYKTFSGNDWIGVFFNGKKYEPNTIPRIYLPFWMGTTIPVVWLLAGISGALLAIILFARKTLRCITNTPERNYMLHLAGFTVPFFAIIIFRYNIYDDWRHLFFIYPSFVLLGIYALHKVSQTKFKIPARLLFIAQFAWIGIFMLRNHPFEQVYFNGLISHKDEYLRKNFDFDYWGSSVKQGYDYILAHDNRPLIKVCYSHEPLYNNYLMLTEAEKKRIQLVENSNDYDYYITNFRSHPDDFDFPQIVYNARVLNSTVMRVYKLR